MQTMLNKILNFLAKFGERAFTTALLAPPATGFAEGAPARASAVIHLAERQRQAVKEAA